MMRTDLSAVPTAVLVILGVLVVVQLTLDVVALVLLARTPRQRVLMGLRWPWVPIIVFVNLLGAIAFLAFGRRPAPAEAAAPEPGGDTVARAVQSLYGERS